MKNDLPEAAGVASGAGAARPHLGLILPNYGAGLDPGVLEAAARGAEEARFDSGWLTDHVIVPQAMASIYGTVSEALVTLGYLAGRTRTLKLGVSALIVPLREPLLALKQLISLDFLSSGRVVTAVAAGWLEEEFATIGSSFSDRGRRLDEWLSLATEAFRRAPGPLRFEGEDVTVRDGWLAPGPAGGGPELWVAGVTKASIRRAAGTGVWHPVALTPDQVRAGAERLRARRADGRVILRLSVYFGPRPVPDATDERGRPAVEGPSGWIAEKLSEFLAAGCDGFVVNLGHDAQDLQARIQRFGEEIAPRLLRGA